MKKINLFISKLLFIVLLLSLYTIANGQKSNTIGIEVSPTRTSMRGNSMIDSYDARFSFAAGFTFEHSNSTKFSLKSGLFYENRGAKTDFEFRDNSGGAIKLVNLKISFNYLTLPILGTFSSNGKFYIDAGPCISFLINQKTLTTSTGGVPDLTDNGTDGFKRLDIGLIFGFGWKFPIGEKLLFNFGLRDNFGLMNTSKMHVMDNGTIKTNSIGLLLGLKYRLN